MQNLLVRKPAILVVFLTLLEAPSSFAQVVPDRTVNSRVNPQSNTIQIEGGATRGNNLFHSFQSFSVPTGNTAYFNNQANIQNIISRVTGNSASFIDGTLKANGIANLFVLNPKGIFFGKNARLDIGGSFLGTTADSITFADGTEFSAATPQNSHLLTISVPVGLDFRSTSGEIRVSGTGHQLPAGGSAAIQPTSRENNPPGLQVLPGKTLALVGGDVSLDNGAIYAPGGRIEIGSVKQGQVSFDSTNPQWSFNYNTQSNFGKILLKNRSLLDTTGTGGASLQMYGRQILLEDASVVFMNNEGITPDKELKLQATELIQITNNAPLRSLPAGLHTGATDLGSGPDVTLISPSLILQGGSIIDTKTYTSANAGNISIEASDFLKIDGTSKARPQVNSSINTITFASGKAGDVSINTSNLLLDNGGRLSSVTFGQGSGGTVSVKADQVEVLGFEPIIQQGTQIQAGSLGLGNAGSLYIDTSRLIVARGGSISTTTLNSGDGGSLVINASEFIEVNGTGSEAIPETKITAEAIQISPILRSFFPQPFILSGNSGNISINTPRLSLTNGGQVSVLNEGTGDAGDLNISAHAISLKGNSLISAETAGGEGGNITLNFGSILIRDSSLTASATQKGAGGNIWATGDLFVALGSSSLTAEAEQNLGGNILITAKAVFFGPEVDLSVSSDAGLQLDGNIRIEVEETDIGDTADLETDIETSPELVSACNPSQGRSSFVVLGPGNLKAKAHHLATTDVLWNASQMELASNSEDSQTDPDLPVLQEAIGWEKIDGKIVLIAEHQDQTTQIASQPATCNKT